MTLYLVVKISDSLEEYPDCKEDTEMFPHLVKYLKDEMDTFIVQDGTENFWKASEFFQMVNINYFSGDL
jgi:hypothetical protein